MNKLTVLMTVFNGEPFLQDTIDSILNQTYSDFDFLIIDNASTDNSRAMIRTFNDPRILLVELQENIGQVAALNKGLAMIDTPFIARMDADDISYPDRFEKQIAFMEEHPEIGICGTYAKAFYGRKKTLWAHPLHHDDIKVKLLFECSLVHPSVMIRKAFLDQYRLKYCEEIRHSYDWELWQRASMCFQLANIPEVLLEYRIHNLSESSRTSTRQIEAANKIDDYSLKLLELDNHPLRSIHRDVAFETLNVKNRGTPFLYDTLLWFEQLKQANRLHPIYSDSSLNGFLQKRLFVVLTNNTRSRKPAWNIFRKEKLHRCIPLSWTVKFILKIWLAVIRPRNPFEKGFPGPS